MDMSDVVTLTALPGIIGRYLMLLKVTDVLDHGHHGVRVLQGPWP